MTAKRKKVTLVIIPPTVIILALCIFWIQFIHDTSYKEPALNLSGNRVYNSMRCIAEFKKSNPLNYENETPLVLYDYDGDLWFSRIRYYLNGEDEPFFKNDGGDFTISYADDNAVYMIMSYWTVRPTLRHDENNIDAHKYDRGLVYDRTTKKVSQVLKIDEDMQFLVDLTDKDYVIYDRNENTIIKYSTVDNSVIQRVDIGDRIYHTWELNFVINDDVCIKFNENNIADVFKDWA